MTPMHLSPDDIRQIIVNLITLVLSITVHEFGHAIVADKLGDRLPRRQGRVTLNPAAHADPLGTLAFPVLSMLFVAASSPGGIGGYPGFGWGRPVQVQPSAMTRKLSMRTAHMLVAAAGPAMNILLAIIVSLLVLVLLKTGIITNAAPIYWPLLNAVYLNCILAFFNLIPAPPLDGGTVLEGLLPTAALPAWHRIAQYGPFILLAFFVLAPLQKLFVVPATHLFLGLIQVLGLPAPLLT
jgi:Zn-dependent protease